MFAGWKEFVKLKMNLWKEFYTDWLESSRTADILVVFYEDLLTDSIEVVRKIMKFLSLPIDENRLDCLAEFPDGGFKRKPPTKQPQNYLKNTYDQELKSVIYAAIDDLNQALIAKDKSPLPIDRYDMYDPREAKVARDLRENKVKSKPTKDFFHVS